MTITGSDEPMLWMEVVNTGSAVFMRDKSKPGGAWSPSSTADDTRSDSIGDYVKALVDAGPAARKGMEQKNGVPAYHLGARMTAAQMKAIDPEEYRKLVDKGVSGKQIDVWIDRAGRVLAHTQSMKIPKDGTTVTTVITVTYTDFDPARPSPRRPPPPADRQRTTEPPARASVRAGGSVAQASPHRLTQRQCGIELREPRLGTKLRAHEPHLGTPRQPGEPVNGDIGLSGRRGASARARRSASVSRGLARCRCGPVRSAGVAVSSRSTGPLTARTEPDR